MKIGIVCSAFPPELDGIGDYSHRLALALQDQGHDVFVFTATSLRPGEFPFEVRDVFSDVRRRGKLLEGALLASKCDWILVQYNPFCYGRRGFSPWLVRALRVISRRRVSHIAVVFHETQVPWWPPRFTVMRLWQAPQLWAVTRVCHVGVVAATRWIAEIRALNPRLPLKHIPVGSNIDLCPSSRNSMKRKVCGSVAADCITLGLFGGLHISRPIEWIAEVCVRAGNCHQRAKVLYVGKDGSSVRNALPMIDVIDGGVLSSKCAGEWLKAMDVLLSPFTDGISTRRGSVMAALQHGTPVASSRRHWSDRILLPPEAPVGVLTSNATTAQGFAGDTMRWMQSIRESPYAHETELARFYQKHFSWAAIAGNFDVLFRTHAVS